MLWVKNFTCQKIRSSEFCKYQKVSGRDYRQGCKVWICHPAVILPV